jgi:uncharacterized protein YndB with AHSA1/START domain
VAAVAGTESGFIEMARSGLLLIADISGYTVYLRESELEHAQGSLTALLELLVGGTRPPLTISRLEGDAVFSYAFEDFSLRGQTLVEMIESLYVAFRRAIDSMVLNTRCRCNACANIGRLDLKFFLHHGEFLTQDIGPHRELVGNDVNLIHRLTKNTVTKTTGTVAYVLYTQAAVEACGLTSLAGVWRSHTERYEDVGAVDCRVQDLHPVWEAAVQQEPESWAPDQIVLDLSIDIAAPREVVWDRLSDPVFRNVLFGSARTEIEGAVDGRTAEDSVFVCYHGLKSDKAGRHVIVEWRPFERVVIRESLNLPGAAVSDLQAFELEDSTTGARVRRMVGQLTGPAPYRLLGRAFWKVLHRSAVGGLRQFRDDVETSLQ